MEWNIKNLPSVLTGGRTINSEDVVELWRIGITVVDDNETLEENIPYVGAPVTEGGIYDGQVWGDDGIDTSKASNHHHSGLKLPIITPSIVTNLTLLYYFLILFPMDYVKGTMLPEMNQRLPGMIQRKMGLSRLVVKGQYSNWERIPLPP